MLSALPNEVRVFIFTVVYALLGMVMLYGGYRVFDWFTPGDMQAKIFKEGNVAVAVLAGAFIIGLAIVILGAVHG
jgi:putative membrane protein